VAIRGLAKPPKCTIPGQGVPALARWGIFFFSIMTLRNYPGCAMNTAADAAKMHFTPVRNGFLVAPEQHGTET
jgi:hypothetical protein